MPILIMLVSAIAIIGLVKYGLVPGIDKLSASLGWSLKTRGKVTGYATSVPELVTLVAAGLSGVWEAGLWNIASSNLINLALAVAAIIVHKRLGEVGNRRFLREIVFAFLGIVAPLLLMILKMDTHVAVIPCLFMLFGAYLFLDKGDGELPECQGKLEDSSAFMGLLTIVAPLVLIVIAGNFLGEATRDVVHVMGVPAVAAGWILGVVTSLPEAVTLFTVFSTKRVAGSGDHCEQMQELLDNLAASNMSNSGLIYPLGLAIFLLSAEML